MMISWVKTRLAMRWQQVRMRDDPRTRNGPDVGRTLLGEDQLAVAGQPQVVLATQVLDHQLAFSGQQPLAGNATDRRRGSGLHSRRRRKRVAGKGECAG